MIFDEDDVLFLLLEFENDLMSPHESAKNGRIGANGLNCFFLILSSYFKSTKKKNYFWQKISCLSDYFEIFVS